MATIQNLLNRAIHILSGYYERDYLSASNDFGCQAILTIVDLGLSPTVKMPPGLPTWRTNDSLPSHWKVIVNRYSRMSIPTWSNLVPAGS